MFTQMYLFNIVKNTKLKLSLRSSVTVCCKDTTCRCPGGWTRGQVLTAGWMGQRDGVKHQLRSWLRTCCRPSLLLASLALLQMAVVIMRGCLSGA